MAQAGSTGYDQYSEDPSLSEEAGGKTSLFGKLKSKTKDQGKKLKTKLKPSSKTSEDSTGDDGQVSEDEPESPVNDAVEGERQPQADEKVSEGAEEPSYETGGSPNVPSSNFPGNFTGIVGDAPSPKEDDSGLSKEFEGLSTNEKSGSENIGELTDSSAPGESTDESKPTTDKLSEGLTSAKDATVGATVGTAAEADKSLTPSDAPPVSEQAQDVGNKAADTGKTWSAWAASKVGLAKEGVAANLPTTAEGKTVPQHTYDTAVGLKDSAYEQAVGAKDAVVDQTSAATDTSSIPSDPAQQSYVQKATTGIFAAKDSLFTSTQPGDHDKALSQKVTESVGNLPASLKSSFGFVAKSPGSTSPTTTPVSTDSSLTSPSDEAAGAPPQSPGLVSRFTSLFAAKKPTSTESATSPDLTETGPTDVKSEE